MHYPRDYKYVSVLKTEDKARVAEMRVLVKQRIAEKTAEVSGPHLCIKTAPFFAV